MKTLLALCLLCCSAHAGLEWEKKEVKLELHPAQATAKAVFRFSNTGKDAITIGDMRVGCGCLAPKLTKRTYAPGEEGVLTIVFDLRNRSGKQSKKTTVRTSDGDTVELVVSGNLSKAYKVSPIMMRFLKGDPKTSKTAKLVNPNKVPIKLLSVSSSHKDLPVELKTIREGFEYEAVVTRSPVASNARAVIRFQVAPPPGQEESKIIKLYVHAQ